MVLTKEQEQEHKKLYRKCQRIYDELEKMPDGTKEKGDKLLEYIATKKLQLKIKSNFGDRMGLKAIEKMYLVGIRMDKWKR